MLEVVINTLPKLPKGLTNRNRTSPFAFTSNKFEFRMVPSSEPIAGQKFVLNTIVAEVLSEIADKFEKSKDIRADVKELLAETWKKKGLPNLTSPVEAWPYFVKEDSVRIFTEHKVFSKEELHTRMDIMLENYSKQINIEAGVVYEMATCEILTV